MPQMSLWATAHPVSFVVRYQYDPRDPLGDSSVSAHVFDQAHNVMARGSVRVGGPHLDEWVADVIHDAWLTYLYGDPAMLQQVMTSTSNAWRSTPGTLRALD